MHRLTLLLTLMLVLDPSSLAAQAVTRVRVPLSATETYTRGTVCTVETKRFTSRKDSAATDTLRIRIENDQNRLAPTAAELDVTVADALTGTVEKNESSLVLAANRSNMLVGKTLTITTEAGVQVCSATIPQPATAAGPGKNAYRVGIGASFDFFDGLSATDLYYDLTIFLPRVLRGRFGVDAGIYSGRTSGPSDTRRNLTRSFIMDREGSDDVLRVTQTIERREEVKYDKLGLFLAPTISFGENLHWALLHAESVKRETETTVGTTILSTDSVVHPDTFPEHPRPSRLPGDTTVTRPSTEYEAFFGTGPILTYQLGDVHFRTKVLIGVGAVDGAFQDFWGVQFRVTDFDNGFKIGGEVRGPFSLENPSVLVYLSKDFAFERLANFLVGGDSD